MDKRGIVLWIPARQMFFFFFLFSKAFNRPWCLPGLQPVGQWVPGTLSPGVNRPGRKKLTAHFHLVSRLRMSGATTPAPLTCLYRVYRDNFDDRSKTKNWQYKRIKSKQRLMSVSALDERMFCRTDINKLLRSVGLMWYLFYLVLMPVAQTPLLAESSISNIGTVVFRASLKK